MVSWLQCWRPISKKSPRVWPCLKAKRPNWSVRLPRVGRRRSSHGWRTAPGWIRVRAICSFCHPATLSFQKPANLMQEIMCVRLKMQLGCKEVRKPRWQWKVGQVPLACLRSCTFDGSVSCREAQFTVTTNNSYKQDVEGGGGGCLATGDSNM